MQSDLESAVCYNHSERLLLSESLEESAAMQVTDTAGTYPNLCGSPLTLQRRRGVAEEEEEEKMKRHRRLWWPAERHVVILRFHVFTPDGWQTTPFLKEEEKKKKKD